MMRVIRSIPVALAFGTAIAVPAWAGGLQEIDQTIFGMDCAPCAAGVEQSLRKLPGVRSVRVSLNEGKAVVALSPGSRTTIGQIREVIRHNGFTPRDARAILVGRVVQEDDRWLIDTGSQRFVLEGDSPALRNRALADATAQEVSLTVRVPEEVRTPPAVQLIADPAGR